MKQKMSFKRMMVVFVCITVSMFFTGCNDVTVNFNELNSKLNGRSATIQTYDEQSNIIDQIHGKSIDFDSDNRFSEDKDAKSEVVDITVGGKRMEHVGSSLILYEDGLTDIFAQYAKKVDVKNFDRSVPFLNRMINSLNNSFDGKSMAVLIRSQSGMPLATFAGNSVSIYATDSGKTTVFLIDGKVLIVYRCDYTTYETALLK
jgi:hypothetical protein